MITGPHIFLALAGLFDICAIVWLVRQWMIACRPQDGAP
jgi:hypothetical protein